MVPCEQHLHGEPVTRSNSSDQDLVGCRLHRVLTVGSWISRTGRRFGSTMRDGLRARPPAGSALHRAARRKPAKRTMIIAQKPPLQRRPATKTVDFIDPDPVFRAQNANFGEK